MADKQETRWHGLDALRVVMTLTVVLFHSSLTYSDRDWGQLWPLKDPNAKSAFFDVVADLIHTFDMPIFFAIAGFSAASLYFQRGSEAMIKNRVLRLLVPFVLAWLALYPLVTFLFAYGNEVMAANPNAFSDTQHFIAHGGLLSELQTYHLWYLYLLMGYCTLFWLGARLLKIPAEAQSRGADALFGRLLGHPFAPLAFAPVTMATLLWMGLPYIDVTLSFVPKITVVVCHAVFFGFGWMLYRRRDRVPVMAARWRWYLGVAGALALIRGLHYLIFSRYLPLDRPDIFLSGVLTSGVLTWLCLFGLIGLFHTKFNGYMPRIRFLSEASYWIYLAHHPFTILLPILIAPLPWPPFLKVPFVFFGALSLTLLTYQLFVRRGFIGRLLNGRRHTRDAA